MFAINILNFLITFVFIQYTSTMIIQKEEKLLLPQTKLFDVWNGCREIRIPINYKKLKIKIKSTNINRLLVTDERINTCNQIWDIKSCCMKNSTFCMENSNPTKNEFQLNYCIDQTFIYACYSPEDPSNNLTKIIDKDEDEEEKEKEKINNDNDKNNTEINNNETKIIENDKTINNTYVEGNSNSTAKRILNTEETVGQILINATIIKGEGCTTAEYLPETECSTLGLINCLDQKKCNKACSFVECRKTKEDEKSKVFSMCLPKELEETEIQERCGNHVAFKDITPQIKKIPCTNQRDITGKEKVSSHIFLNFLLVLSGSFALIFFISSVISDII